MRAPSRVREGQEQSCWFPSPPSQLRPVPVVSSPEQDGNSSSSWVCTCPSGTANPRLKQECAGIFIARTSAAGVPRQADLQHFASYLCFHFCLVAVSTLWPFAQMNKEQGFFCLEFKSVSTSFMDKAKSTARLCSYKHLCMDTYIYAYNIIHNISKSRATSQDSQVWSLQSF